MTLTSFVVYCLVFKTVLWVGQKASKSYLPLIKHDKLRGFLEQLVSCELCFGTWIYTLGAFLLHINVLYEYGYVPVINEMITGIVTSFILWVFTAGWNSKFQIVWIDPQE
jgi:hypothetical protein